MSDNQQRPPSPSRQALRRMAATEGQAPPPPSRRALHQQRPATRPSEGSAPQPTRRRRVDIEEQKQAFADRFDRFSVSDITVSDNRLVVSSEALDRERAEAKAEARDDAREKLLDQNPGLRPDEVRVEEAEGGGYRAYATKTAQNRLAIEEVAAESEWDAEDLRVGRRFETREDLFRAFDENEEIPEEFDVNDEPGVDIGDIQTLVRDEERFQRIASEVSGRTVRLTDEARERAAAEDIAQQYEKSELGELFPTRTFERGDEFVLVERDVGGYRSELTESFQEQVKEADWEQAIEDAAAESEYDAEDLRVGRRFETREDLVRAYQAGEDIPEEFDVNDEPGVDIGDIQALVQDEERFQRIAGEVGIRTVRLTDEARERAAAENIAQQYEESQLGELFPDTTFKRGKQFVLVDEGVRGFQAELTPSFEEKVERRERQQAAEDVAAQLDERYGGIFPPTRTYEEGEEFTLERTEDAFDVSLTEEFKTEIEQTRYGREVADFLRENFAQVRDVYEEEAGPVNVGDEIIVRGSGDDIEAFLSRDFVTRTSTITPGPEDNVFGPGGELTSLDRYLQTRAETEAGAERRRQLRQERQRIAEETGVDFEDVNFDRVEGELQLSGETVAAISREFARDAGVDLSAGVEDVEVQGPALVSGGAMVSVDEIQAAYNASFEAAQGPGVQGIDVEAVERVGEERAAIETERRAVAGRLSGAASAGIDVTVNERADTEVQRFEQAAEVFAPPTPADQVSDTPEAYAEPRGRAGQAERIEEQIAEQAPVVEFSPGEGDVVQGVERWLKRQAEAHQEGRGWLPNADQAAELSDAAFPIGAPSEQQSETVEGISRWVGERGNPAGAVLALGKVGEGVGEFGFNVVASASPLPGADVAEYEELSDGYVPPEIRQNAKASPNFQEREEAAVRAAGGTAADLASDTVEALRERPWQTLGSGIAEVGFAIGGGVVAGRALGRGTRFVRDRVRTVGARKIPLEDVTQSQVIRNIETAGKEGRPFPGAENPRLYRSNPAEAVRRQAADYTPANVERYFEEAGATRGSVLKKAADVEPEGPGVRGFEAVEGAYESPGAFVGPELSPYFFRLGKRSSRLSLRPGLPDMGGRPTGVLARVEVRGTSGQTLDDFAEELLERSGEPVALTKPGGTVTTSEIEAVIPPGAQFTRVGSGSVLRETAARFGIGSEFYTKVGGRRVPLRPVRALDESLDSASDAARARSWYGTRVSGSLDEFYRPLRRPVDRPVPFSSFAGSRFGRDLDRYASPTVGRQPLSSYGVDRPEIDYGAFEFPRSYGPTGGPEFNYGPFGSASDYRGGVSDIEYRPFDSPSKSYGGDVSEIDYGPFRTSWSYGGDVSEIDYRPFRTPYTPPPGGGYTPITYTPITYTPNWPVIDPPTWEPPTRDPPDPPPPPTRDPPGGRGRGGPDDRRRRPFGFVDVDELTDTGILSAEEASELLGGNS